MSTKNYTPIQKLYFCMDTLPAIIACIPRECLDREILGKISFLMMNLTELKNWAYKLKDETGDGRVTADSMDDLCKLQREDGGKDV